MTRRLVVLPEAQDELSSAAEWYESQRTGLGVELMVEIDAATARASVASWFGLAKHADAFRLSKRIFSERDVVNAGKRLLVRSLGQAVG